MLQVAWRKLKDGKFVFLTIGVFNWAPGNDVHVEHRVDSEFVSHWDLLIKKVKPQDAGLYECQITAKQKQTRNVTLNVVGEYDLSQTL